MLIVAKNSTKKRIRPAATAEARENQLISLAVDLAEKQMIEGTASPSVITHYLKLGSSKQQLELEKIKHENELLRAKTDNLEAQKNMGEMYDKAISAMKLYSGANEEDEFLYDEEL